MVVTRIGLRIDPRHGAVRAVRGPHGAEPEDHGARAAADRDPVEDVPGPRVDAGDRRGLLARRPHRPGAGGQRGGVPADRDPLRHLAGRRSMRTTSPSSAVATQSAPSPTATARRPLPTGIRCTTLLAQGSTWATSPLSIADHPERAAAERQRRRGRARRRSCRRDRRRGGCATPCRRADSPPTPSRRPRPARRARSRPGTQS